MVPGQTQWQGWLGVWVVVDASWRQRIDSHFALQPDGASRPYHRANGYVDPAMFKAGPPYGASSVSQNKALPPTPDDPDAARFQGRRVALVAEALKAAEAR